MREKHEKYSFYIPRSQVLLAGRRGKTHKRCLFLLFSTKGMFFMRLALKDCRIALYATTIEIPEEPGDFVVLTWAPNIFWQLNWHNPAFM